MLVVWREIHCFELDRLVDDLITSLQIGESLLLLFLRRLSRVKLQFIGKLLLVSLMCIDLIVETHLVAFFIDFDVEGPQCALEVAVKFVKLASKIQF